MNKKIKVIELLNKIANGEELPKKIKIIGKNSDEYFEYDLDEKKYLNKNNERIGESWILDEILDNEVEIIEEEIIEEEPDKEELKEIEEYYYSGVPKWTSSELVIIKTLNKIIRKLENKDE